MFIRAMPLGLPAALAFLSLFAAAPATAETQTLEQALVLCYRNNPGLQARRAELKAMDERVSQAMSGWRPSIDAVAGAGKAYQELSGKGMLTGTDTLTPREAGITIKQPLFRGFRTENEVKAAEAMVRAGRAGLLNAEQQLLFDTAKAYLDVLQNRAVLELTRNNEEVLGKQLEAVKERFRIGEVTKTDLSQSEARLNAAAAARIKAEGGLADARAAFLRLVGDEPGDLRRPDISIELPQSGDEAAALAEKNHPAVIAAEFSRDAAEFDVKTADGALLPEIDLVGNVSRGWERSLFVPGRQDDAVIMARLTMPLYRSGADYSRARAARQTSVQRRLELEDKRRAARELAVRSWQSLMTARAAIAAHKTEIAAAELALHGVMEESRAGTRTILDVLNAEQELLDAKVNLVKAEHDEAVAILQLKFSIGSLTAESMKLPVEIYDPSLHYKGVRGKWIGAGGD